MRNSIGVSAAFDTVTRMQPQQNIPLAPFTTFKVGGPARYFLKAESPEQVLEAVEWARSQNLALFVLGGGSNLVVSDGGWHGLVLQIAIAGMEEHSEAEKRVFKVGAGMEWDAFVAHAVSLNCGGIECMSGIPGTVGGTPVQNVGAYGQEVGETIQSVDVLDLQNGNTRVLAKEECGFRYRSSIFNGPAAGRYIVLRVSYGLRPGAHARIEYADLKKFFGGKAEPPSLLETRDAVRQIRRSKAMLLVDGDPDCRSAGSFFKNPIVTPAKYEELRRKPAARGEIAPQFPGAEGKMKVSAAWLVERAGFHRGYVHGNVGISSKHALAIVNRGGAKATEIIALKEEIQAHVAEAFDVQLYPEPVFVGFETGV